MYTRRQALAGAGKAGVAGAMAISLPPQLLGATPARSGVMAQGQLRTLRAAVARIVPAEGAGDWSAADVGADNYILTLLSGIERIYAGGPVRSRFPRPRLSLAGPPGGQLPASSGDVAPARQPHGRA